jgi:hypothetical protein
VTTAYKALQKGMGWEYRVHRAVFLAGWYVRRGVNLRERVVGSPQTLGEVDVVGISFDAGLKPNVLVGECKDRKGGAKEADRVVWLLGLKQVLRADHVLFAKPNLAEGTYIFARPLEVALWDEASVRALEQRHGLDYDSGFGGSFNIELREAFQAPKFRDKSLKAAVDYVRNAFWYGQGVRRVKQLASYFEVVGAADVDEETRDVLVAEGLLALMHVALVAAGQLQRVSPARATTWLHETLAAGVAPAAALRDIAGRADDYYRDAWSRTARERGEDGRLTVPRLVDHIAQPPPWLGEFQELAQRLGERSQPATDLLRFSDLVLFEQLVAGNPVPAPLLGAIAADAQELMRLLQLGGYFLRRVWGVEARLVARLLDQGAVATSEQERAPTLFEQR